MLGVDIVQVSRFSNMKSISRFMDKCFTDLEKTYIEQKHRSLTSIAGFWAAKEAVAKVLGTGFSGFSFKDIEIQHDELNRPIVKLYNNANNLQIQRGFSRIDISISHEKEYAVAIALGYEK